MQTTVDTPRFKAAINSVLIGVFLLALVLPSVDMILHLDPAPVVNENRALAEKPSWPSSLGAVPETFAKLESYFADHFGFRKSLVRFYRRLKYVVFRVSPTDTVLIGKDGWIFPELQNSLELYRNIQPWTDKEVESFVQKIRERQAWADEHGMQYIYMVGPDSLTLNPEHLPDWATKVNPGSRLDQLIERARKYDIDILDFREPLREAKKFASVSYRTDTHWNLHGGYIAYRQILRRIAQRYPEVGEPLLFTEYEKRAIKTSGMDLTVLMGLQDLIDEEGDDIVYIGKRDYETTEREGLHFTTSNKDVPEFPVAFVCDSMAGNIAPHMGRHFSKVRYLWGYLFQPEEIMRYKPKVLLHLVIERSLSIWAQTENPQEVKDAFVRKYGAPVGSL